METDALSRFLRQNWARVKTGFRPEKPTVAQFEEHLVIRAVNGITILVAAFFLVGSMITFYFVKNEVAKLVLIALFTTAFSGCIGVITSARRAEIFAATAAYAAVLVVFVSSGLQIHRCHWSPVVRIVLVQAG
ncbi:hypothetical protein QBC35DRAFT_467821 [Podospora australis]|uniref:DUF6594 domain-containing protein n=1 Tax=Podospora australis TaxID=1536484 RepID=A0AAN7AD43_9PEZI|nr:hypothetical protein QBC35DRAFT_467821 [Podospora australis]